MNIDKSKYTHYASVYFIPCYFNDSTNELTGTNEFFDFLLEYIAIPIQEHIIFLTSIFDSTYEPAYIIKIKGKIK